MRLQSSSASPRLRRRRRILGAFPVVLASFVVVNGLPVQPAPPGAGTLHTDEILLTGPEAEPTAAASGTTRTRTAVPDAATEGWSAAVDVDDGTQAVAVSWTGEPEGEVEVRGRTTDGWSEWMHVHGNPHEGPDAGSGDGSDVTGDLLWFGGDGIDAVEVVVEEGTLEDLKLEAMRYEQPEASSLQTAFAMPVAGAADTKPAILPRTQWTSKGWAYSNADCGKGPIIPSGGVKFAVVHHTVNSNTYSQSDVPAMLASIYQFHTGTRGWCDIAYNFVIDRFGRTWEGRSGSIANAVVGGHAAGFNTNSVGVSFLGQHQPGESTYSAVAPTAAQLSAAGNLIGWKLGQNGVPATGTVTVKSASGSSGAKFPEGTSATIQRVTSHRDVGHTSCPGNLLYSQLGTIRSTAASVASKTTPTVPSAPTTTSTTLPPVNSRPLGPFSTARQLVDQSYKDLLRRDPNSSERTVATAAIEGGQKAEVFLANVVNGREMDANVKQVIRLYRAYFLRTPDHAGLDFWVTRRRWGWNLSRISAEFANAQEFKNRYGSLSSSGFIDLVYRNVLQRSPDQGGRSYWSSRLNGGQARGQMMIGFSESPEYVRKTSAGVTIVALYDGMIHRRIPDGTYDYLEPRLRTGITDASGVARFFMDKPEYHARF